MSPIVLAIISNPESRLQLESAVNEFSAECIYVAFGEHLTDLVKRTNPFLLIVELNNENSNWLQRHLSEIKADHSEFPMIGITSKDSESEYARLERAGCSRIVNHATFQKKVKILIGKYLR